MARDAVIHGKTIAGDRLCPARGGIATVFLSEVTCEDCRHKLAATPDYS